MEINHQRAKELGHSTEEINQAETTIEKQNLLNENIRRENRGQYPVDSSVAVRKRLRRHGN